MSGGMKSSNQSVKLTPKAFASGRAGRFTAEVEGSSFAKAPADRCEMIRLRIATAR